MKTKSIIISAMMLLAVTTAQAQINIQGKVFGGARQANVEGHTYVRIGADNHDVIINSVYGGNDIAGTIGTGATKPAEITSTHMTATELASFNTYVRTEQESTGKHLFIGELFGGSYGDYGTYTTNTSNINKYDITVPFTRWDEGQKKYIEEDVPLSQIDRPDVAKSYVDIHGGTIGYVYGGGNNVTVTQNPHICINNLSTPTTSILDSHGSNLLNATHLTAMKLPSLIDFVSDNTYQIARVFGGNNKAVMSVRPTWHLQAGKIENVYSGGNEGAMTSTVGLLLEIKPDIPQGATATEASEINARLFIDNVYGGCRKADVHPLTATGEEPRTLDIQLPDLDDQNKPKYNFIAGLPARVLVYGGNVNNVYGGNDITGRVYGGNSVGVYHSIRGSIYGGGNGSYPYTDNPNLTPEKSLLYGDFYYNPATVLSNAGITAAVGYESVTALNEFRPNAEQVSIRVKGESPANPTVIGGAIYCGGNSATLKSKRTDALVQLKIGSYVIAENVFLGNNGENMIKYNKNSNDASTITDDYVLNRYSHYVNTDGTLTNTVIAGSKFNSMNLTDPTVFAKYMDGCASTIMPIVSFDGDDNDGLTPYIAYSTYFGSFFCGGNVGSVIKEGKMTINFNKSVIVYDKVVGGCNNAFVPATDYNALYEGGIIGSDGSDDTPNERDAYTDTNGHIKDRIEFNFRGLKIQPLRMPISGYDNPESTAATIVSGMKIPMVWNTIRLGERDNEGNHVPVAWDNYTWADGSTDAEIKINSTMNRRFTGGNIYGGCCASGIVNGNVVINIDSTIVDRDIIFAKVEKDDVTGEDRLYGNTYNIQDHRTGVILDQQGMDVLGSALNIFGGGKGVQTEIWGSATVNLKKGYVFQIFGGSEQGAIGKRGTDTSGNYTYSYNSDYSTYVNLIGSSSHPGVPKIKDMSEDLAEVEFIYGGGFEGPILGDTHVTLNNGRLFNSFAGSCNADIQGHTETYIGQNGFPYCRDHIYGGNDLGGKILGEGNFTSRVRDNDNNTANGNGNLAMVHNTDADGNNTKDVLQASAYIEYNQGHVYNIFGGCYGVYDYTDKLYGDYFHAKDAEGTTNANLGMAKTELGYSKPYLKNAFVNFRPVRNNGEYNKVEKIYGAGQGYFMEKEENLLQDRSYILVDVNEAQNFKGTEVFGGGECGGVGMGVVLSGNKPNLDGASAIIDLVSGEIKAAYGGSYKEGITRRTLVNVPDGSTIIANSIFGGAYGFIEKIPRTNNGNPVLDSENKPIVDKIPRIDVACDVYEAIVNYNSEDATIKKAIYGGNNDCRRTLYGQVNINAPVYNGSTNADKSVKYTATVYGAGCGVNTWSQYTEVNLNDGASVYEAYGGGEDGKVLNLASVLKWQSNKAADTNDDYKLFTGLEGYEDLGLADNTPANSNQLYTVDNTRPQYYNTNVHINKGATVGGYCYGGGLGHGNIAHSGNVYGTTYIDLLGGNVVKDLYAAGTTGSVKDSLGVKGTFIASATAYIEGGSARNVYGGGWKGSVGHHMPTAQNDTLAAPYYDTATGELIDIPGETHVIIGILKDKLPTTIPEGETADYYYYNGIPTIKRNAYGGGEGGAVWGTTNVTLNNGYIGYEYDGTKQDVASTLNIDERYVEKIEDETHTDSLGHFLSNKRLDDAGCIFGGGYIDNSSVDFTNVTMYGGHVRNALFGGGEIAAIGRGRISETTNAEGKKVRTLTGIYRPGKTHIEMFDGHVHRNVFGGGRGYNNLGNGGHLFSDGYVFGQTEVHVHGGEIGTLAELNKGNGNVFGGGDIGYVYSAYEYDDGQGHMLPRKGVKSGVRYDGDGMYQGYYYEHVWENDNATESNFIHYNGTERKLTEDCKVLIEPYCKLTGKHTGADSKTYTIKYYKGQIVSENNLRYLKSINSDLLNSSTIDDFGKVIASGGISFSRTFHKGEYVVASALNTLGNKTDDEWKDLEANSNDDGIIIHNAVFAGGNTTKGADDQNAYAGSYSVYGNATASVHDCYHRDLITIGTGHVGGLYGDGNLTLVDGYRGLNITNYGTDYHYLYEEENMKELRIDQYEGLLDREKDYYELRYKCIKDCMDDDKTSYYAYDATLHPVASTLTADDIFTLFAKQNGENGTVNMFSTDSHGNIIPNPTYWQQNGVCSIYAGRILNTIQRADFCGVFGSRLVMQGAQDRVPEVVDYTKYTINRVREVSLNRKYSVIDADASNDRRKMHGNYFGIYSVVNFLGALTSDFDFGSETAGEGEIRTTDNKDDKYSDAIEIDNNTTYNYGDAGYTFYNWKKANHTEQLRNNGNSHNKVALASGVYLELTTEESTGKELNEKVWGLITGVVELDLINVQQGMGGGFVYAKNVHGVRTKTGLTNTTLTALNAGAATRWDYRYEEPSLTSNDPDPNQKEWQTSGNFVHNTQIIIDDCYNYSGKYKGPDRVPAHYWYIKGSVYVYDQYISAYTGVSNAYTEAVNLPLTITAASHGKIKLLNVQPNRYAYYSNSNKDKLGAEQKLIINNKEYYLNDPISYWDWYMLSAAERELFVEKTYVTTDSCMIGTTYFAPGYVMLPTEYNTYKTAAQNDPEYIIRVTKEPNSDPVIVKDKEGNPVYLAFDDVFHESNNLSHDTGYMLTYSVNNPKIWDTWYSPISGESSSGKITTETYEGNSINKADYQYGPTYRFTDENGGVLGQRDYKVSDIIPQNVKTKYDAITTSLLPGGQASFEQAYIATADIDIVRAGNTAHLKKGSTLSASEANGKSNVAPALVCTKTIQISSEEIIYINAKMTAGDKNNYVTTVNNRITAIAGSAISEMSDLSPEELNALTSVKKKELADLLQVKKDINKYIENAYYCTEPGLYGGDYYVGGKNYAGLEVWSSMTQSDHAKFAYNYDALDLLIDPSYSLGEGVKYQYDSSDANLAGAQANRAQYSLERPIDYTATFTGTTGTYNGVSLENGVEYDRTVYESLPNEQRHYAPITVTTSDVGTNPTTFYVVNSPLLVGYTPYAVGSLLTKDEYDILVAKDALLGEGEPREQDKVSKLTFGASGTWYYCREAYTPVGGGDAVAVGTLINSTAYGALKNMQKDFIIHGITPKETSTLFVSRFSDIDDLTKEKIITVIYEYNYEESDATGSHITPITERHVVNIHIDFKTGAPTVEDIEAPPIILPGDYLGLIEPNFIEGASPVVGGGWELYETDYDADIHNGIEYTPNIDPLYWYQHGYWLRYYVLSHIGGKTYSNKVQVSVANYHDLKKVMEDKNHHYYIDIVDQNRLRDPKVYIKDGTDGLNQLKNLFDLSLLDDNSTGVTDGVVTASGSLNGHALLDSRIRNCNHLEFFMRTNINQTGTWTPIGSSSQECFAGTLHGDGHYISGLDHSLFGELCGNIYNLGVTGSFSSAGIADTGNGFVENCWISTTGNPDGTVRAVFGNPSATNGTKIVNCYYPTTKNYKTEDNGRGLARPMPVADFYNGTVAYNLNGFYLYKRYFDKKAGTTGTSYNYYIAGVTDPTTERLDPKTEYYEENVTLCSSGALERDAQGNLVKDKYDNAIPIYAAGGYVEDRYADGDYRYAGGEIPTYVDERMHSDDVSVNFYPIWPDDYLFFGQMLTYGWDDLLPHEDVPSPIVKSEGRLATDDTNNRVYRAPAYYRNATMDVAHFNPNVNLVSYSKPKVANDTNLNAAYPNMTAIDFAGHNDIDVDNAYKLGLNGKWFYQPLLDDDGLKSIFNRNETPNLLVYAPARTASEGYANKATYDVLNSYFTEPAYSDYYKDVEVNNPSYKYRSVDPAPTETVVGHLVQNDLRTTNDHLLVDEKDFDCPIDYYMGSGKHMWYQRTAKTYVDLSKGWEGISLPFKAELVTTNEKGEITHFYSGSYEVYNTNGVGASKEGSGNKVGHEYWLSEYKDVSTYPAEKKAEALFQYPDANNSDDTKTVNNTFLWDYYYYNSNATTGNNHKDANDDTYQTFYSTPRSYDDYPLLANGKPYIIGFPGKTYYEFDLSGTFEALTTADNKPAQLGEQTISFVSELGYHVDVSDNEKAGVTHNGFTFKPSYLNQELEVGTNNYTLKADGSAFDKVPATGTAKTPVSAFRPYFTVAAGLARQTRSIVFINGADNVTMPNESPDTHPFDKDNPGTLKIWAERHKIVVTSALNFTTDVRIVNTAGITIKTFTIEPGETVETRINNAGVYIVQPSEARYIKKLSVK